MRISVQHSFDFFRPPRFFQLEDLLLACVHVRLTRSIAGRAISIFKLEFQGTFDAIQGTFRCPAMLAWL